MFLVKGRDWQVDGDERSDEGHDGHADEEPVGPFDHDRLLDEQVELSSCHRGDREANEEAQHEGGAHDHERFVHENAPTFSLGEAHGAQHAELPNGFLDVLGCAYHEQEERDDEGNNSDDGYEDVEDDSELVKALVYGLLLENDNGAVSDDAQNPVVQILLLF